MQFKYLKHDIYRYFYPNDETSEISLAHKLRIIMTTQGIWAIAVYRVRRWSHYECQYPFIRKMINPIAFLINMVVEIATGIHIEPEIDIGPGLYIGHYGNIFLGGSTRIGKFANISHEVTVGYAGRGNAWGLPVIGDHVFLAPGAKVIGKIVIGNNVAIGTNSVVTKSLPDNAVAVGVPAKIINFNSSKDFVLYNHKKNIDIL